MERKDFIALVGGGAAASLLAVCAACTKSGASGAQKPPVIGPVNVSFTLDLTLSANAPLLANGGSVVSNNIIVARTNTGTYIAAQQSCTHESYPLSYQASSKRFYCSNHGSTFTEGGVVQGPPASQNLTIYKTSLSGTTLTVSS